MAKQAGKVSKSSDNHKGTANRYGVSYSFDIDDTPPYDVSWAGVSIFVVSDEEYSKNPTGEAYDNEQGSTSGIVYYDSLQKAEAMLKDAMSCANHDIVIDASLSDSDKKYLADDGIVVGKAGMQYFHAKLGLYDEYGNHGGKRQTFLYDASEFEVVEVQRESGDTTPYKTLKYVGGETDGSKIKIPNGVKTCDFMFDGINLNDAPIIPNSVEDTEGMFNGILTEGAYTNAQWNLAHPGFDMNDEEYEEPSGFDITRKDCKDAHAMMFYTGGGGSYKHNTANEIAAWGKRNFEKLKDKTIEEIKRDNLYWGSDEAAGHNLKGGYNGDTYVLFDSMDALSDEYKHDAMFNTKTRCEFGSIVSFSAYDTISGVGQVVKSDSREGIIAIKLTRLPSTCYDSSHYVNDGSGIEYFKYDEIAELEPYREKDATTDTFREDFDKAVAEGVAERKWTYKQAPDRSKAVDSEFGGIEGNEGCSGTSLGE